MFRKMIKSMVFYKVVKFILFLACIGTIFSGNLAIINFLPIIGLAILCVDGKLLDFKIIKKNLKEEDSEVKEIRKYNIIKNIFLIIGLSAIVVKLNIVTGFMLMFIFALYLDLELVEDSQINIACQQKKYKAMLSKTKKIKA